MDNYNPLMYRSFKLTKVTKLLVTGNSAAQINLIIQLLNYIPNLEELTLQSVNIVPGGCYEKFCKKFVFSNHPGMRVDVTSPTKELLLALSPYLKKIKYLCLYIPDISKDDFGGVFANFPKLERLSIYSLELTSIEVSFYFTYFYFQYLILYYCR